MEQFDPSLDKKIEFIREYFHNGFDIIIRRFFVKHKDGKSREMAVFFIDGLSDKNAINSDIMQPLLSPIFTIEAADNEIFKYIFSCVINSSESSIGKKITEMTTAVLNGDSILLIEGISEFAILGTKKFDYRAVTEPDTDVVVRGPREGFVENMQTNISLLRRKIKHPGFTIENRRIGRFTNTNVCIIYLEGVTDKGIVKEINRRMDKLDIDGILDSGYVEQLTEDSPLSIFPTVASHEKPDIIAAKILEGKVAIMIDGTPGVLTVPAIFTESFHNSEDYYSRFYYFSLIRLIRWIAFLASTLLPGIYIAITTYHQVLLPSNLLLVMAAAEKSTPFSTGSSILVMSIIYEILREAGVRLPRPVGQTVSIVGALVMGDAAVSANLISAPVLIIVALATISSFVNANLYETAAVLRILFIFAGWSMGGFGLLMLAMFLMVYLTSMKSFSVPYLSPIAPFDKSGFREVFVRFPLWMLKKRPPLMSANVTRMAENLRPKPTEQTSKGNKSL